MRAPLFFFAAASLLGCSGGEAGDPPAQPATPRAWQRLATPTSELPAVRGLSPRRGIVHSHSPYSHDACDGEGIAEDGTLNAPCAADLRRGMCEAAEDFVFLTDHADHMAEFPFESLLFLGDGDAPVPGPDGAPIANRVACGDGRSVLVTVGNEDELMSLGLERHLPGDAATRKALYDGNDAATVQAMRDAGALVWIPHTESRTMDYLLAMPYDGIEVYNLHAAIDPDIREPYLGVDPAAAFAGVLQFTKLSPEDPEPDLCFLGIVEDLDRYTEIWDALLAVRRVPGVAGTDVHQNTFPGTLRDEERGDSYRRLMRWFSNVVLASGELDPAALKAALREGRSYIAFEIFGVPANFDFHAESGGADVEMGGAAPAGASLHARAPVVFDLDPAVTPPDITMRLFRVTASGTDVVGEGAEIDLDAAEPGAYRVEVRITPHHLRPYLGPTPDGFIESSLWVRSNPIYVE